MLLGAVVFVGAWGWQSIGLRPEAAGPSPEAAAASAAAEEAAAEALAREARAEQMAELQQELRRRVADAPARKAAVFVQDLETGLTAGANADEQFLSASLIKLPVMAAAYERWARDPELKTKTHLTWMEWMITVSDNASTDRLIDMVGGPEVVIRFCEDRDWPEFRVRHAILNHKGRRGNNICTARQVTQFLAALDERKLVNPEADEEMWELLCRQKRRLRIPAGLPKSQAVQVGNKTGTLSNALHDAGIVRTDRARWAITILMSGQRGEYRGNKFCSEISRLAYDTLHGPADEPDAEPAVSVAE